MQFTNGTVYQTDKGLYGLAIDADQLDAYKKVNKMYIRLYEDCDCLKPVIDQVTGMKVHTLVPTKNLKPVDIA